MPGAEKWLPDELIKAVEGKDVDPRYLNEVSPDFSVYDRGGSANIPTMAAAIWALKNPHDAGIFSWWRRYFSRAKGAEGRGFMEHEPLGTSVYTVWTVTAVGCVQLVPALRKEAEQWLRAFWGYATLCTATGPSKEGKGNYVALAGARSMNQEDRGGRSYLDVWVPAAIGMNNGVPQIEWVDQLYASLRARAGVDLYGLDFSHRKMLVDHVRRGDRVNFILPLIERYRPMVPFRFIRTADGVASVMERGINNNTAPVYAQIWEKGEAKWLTLDNHPRRNVVLGTAEVIRQSPPFRTLIIASNKLTSNTSSLSGAVQYEVHTHNAEPVPPPTLPPVDDDKAVVARYHLNRAQEHITNALRLLS